MLGLINQVFIALLSFLNKKEKANINVFNLIKRTNKKTLTKRTSCKWKQKFDGRKCNSNQKWNKNKCKCDCKHLKQHYTCEEGYA